MQTIRRGTLAAGLLAVALLVGKPAGAQQSKIPVWVHGGAPGSANRVVATLTDGAEPPETLGLWPVPFTGFEPLDFEFAPVAARPGGWAAVDWLLPGSYRVTVTWWDESGTAHPLAPYTLNVL